MLFLCVSVQAEVADRIVAVVNDEVITLSELNSAFEPYQAKLEASYTGAGREKAMTEARADPPEPDDRQSAHGAAGPEGRDRRPG